MTVSAGPEKPAEHAGEPNKKKKWEPAVVAAIITAFGAFGAGIMTAGSGLISGIMQAKTTTVTTVETSTMTVHVTVSAPVTTSGSANEGGPAGHKSATSADALSLREVPPLSRRAFNYGRYSVAGQAREPAMAGKVDQYGSRSYEDYQMPSGYGTFRATVGLADGAQVDSTCEFEVVVDSQAVKRVIVLAGKTASLEAVIGQNKAFQLVAKSKTAEGTAVWIEPVLTR